METHALDIKSNLQQTHFHAPKPLLYWVCKVFVTLSVNLGILYILCVRNRGFH